MSLHLLCAVVYAHAAKLEVFFRHPCQILRVGKRALTHLHPWSGLLWPQAIPVRERREDPSPSSAPKPPSSKKRRSTSTPPSPNIMTSTPGSKTPATSTPADSTVRRGIANNRTTETRETISRIRAELQSAKEEGRKARKTVEREDGKRVRTANYTLPKVPNWDLPPKESLLYNGRRGLPRDHENHDDILMDCAKEYLSCLDKSKAHNRQDLLKLICGMIN